MDPNSLENLEDSKSLLEKILDSIAIRWYTMWLAFVFSLANAADAVELMCVSYLIPSAAQVMHMGAGRKGILSSSSFVGMMIGGVIGGCSADKFGRRKALWTSLLINGLSGLASSFQPFYVTFLVFRLLAAVGVGASIPIVWTYFAEFLPIGHRGLMLTLVSSSWMFGSVACASLALLIIPQSDLYGWRYFTMASSAPAFIAFVLVLFIPESPKYLLAKYGNESCWSVVEYVARRNRNSDAVIKFKAQFLSSQHRHEQTSSVLSLMFSRNRSLTGLRNQLWLLIVIVSLLCYGYYGILMWMPDMLTGLESNASGLCRVRTRVNEAPSKHVYIDSILIAISSLPGNLFSLFFIDSLGRRCLLVPSLMVSGLSVLLMSVIKSRSAALVFACIFSALSVIPFNVLNCLGTEMFPTEFRSSAFGVQYMFGRIGAICATFTFGYMLDVFCSLPLLIVSVNLCLAGIVSCALRETSNIEIF